MSMSSHSSPRPITDNWLTPPYILNTLGHFTLDPCCPPIMPWRTAAIMLSLPHAKPIASMMFIPCQRDGLEHTWGTGRVFLNPPWGRSMRPWMGRMADHNNGIALIPARTETQDWFNFVWNKATAVCFIKGRPKFHYPDGSQAKNNCGCPVALVAYGEFNAEVLQACNLGKVVRV